MSSSGVPDDFMALVTSDEPLHPDLLAYYTEDGAVGASLSHPLVYMIAGVRPGLANHVYQQKTDALDRAMAAGNWHRFVYLHERPWRLTAFMSLDADGWLGDEDYWRLLGSIWTDSENIWQMRDEWIEVLSSDRPGREFLMDEDDQREYDVLPDTLTVYRGAARNVNEDGLSWTLDYEKASWFAQRRRRRTDAPLVVHGTVAKTDAIAVFHSRDEYEVVILNPARDVTVTRTEQIPSR
jgi:hypothetical protein